MVKYVKRKGSQYDTWHWCKNCSNYPKKGEEVTTRDTRPSYDLCNQCLAKEDRRDCRK